MSLSTHSSKDFIREIIDEDLAAEKHDSPVTRFPPEPNGYLHLGHAKSICLNFGIAQEYGGRCHLRFDDTNPTKEEVEYVDSIKEDIKWLGFNWGEHLYFASDYFEKLYEWALALIKNGKAYVDEQSAAEIRSNRGDLQNAGIESPLASDNSDAAVYWASIIPEFTPDPGTRNDGRPDRFPYVSRKIRRSAIDATCTIATFRWSIARATGAAWKCPPSTMPWPGKTMGLSPTPLSSRATVVSM